MAKNIKDPLYGSIYLPKLLMQFVDTPIFQRLRRLRQLGPVHHVYPSMNHTRFEHSIGVAHLAGVVIEHLGLSVDIRTKHLIQLAGLFHDIGHGPFSHLWDDYLTEISHDQPHHETRSVRAVTIIKRGLITQGELSYVCGIIQGTIITDPPCLGQIINNYVCGVDVDKLDYLCRDAYHGSLPGIDVNYIIANIRLDMQGNLAFRETSRSALEDLFYVRGKLHNIVYQHPTVLKFKAKYLEGIRLLYGEDPPDCFDVDDFSVEVALRSHSQTVDIMAEIDTRSFLHDLSEIQPSANLQTWAIVSQRIPFV